ncbi:hypothetical protein K501DRAFT_311640 [Backusella circina FSU 941]|nr:hypothetical protein K501DRAFT_311640 [Backusella circina FSU 941]
MHEFNNIKQVLQLTRLIQIYAKIIGPDIDQIISAKEQASSLTSLASLFIEFLKTILDMEHQQQQQQSVLDMVTEFTVALCSLLPRYQENENPTQHTLDTVWFVYSMMLDTHSNEAVCTLSVAFSTWIQSLSADQFDIVIQKFMEQSQKELNEKEQLAFLSLLAVLLKSGSDVHKKQLGKTISTFVLKLSLMAGKTRSLKFLQQVLKFLLQISNNQTYHLTEYDVSLLLSCLFQVAHPTALQRFKTEINESLAHDIFDNVCAVISSLIGQRKEQVVDMLPPLIAFIQSLMHCFKSTHVSLVGNATHISNKKRKHVDNKTKTQQNTTTEQFGNRTVPLLVSFAPLNDTSAQKFSRLLSALPSKQSATGGGKSGQSMYKTIAKHTPSIIIEYFNIQSNSTMSIIQPTKKSILVGALYDVFDMCNDSDRSFIMSCLDGSGKSLFKSFYSGWKETHKYSGE